MHLPTRTETSVQGPNRPGLWLIAYLVLALVFTASEPILIFSTTSEFGTGLEQLAARVETGSQARQISFIALGAFGAFLLLFVKNRSVVPRNFLAFVGTALVAWMAFSLTWSADPFLSVKRLVVLFLMCLGAFGVSKYFGARGLWILVFAVSASYLFLGIIIELNLGTFTPFTQGYRFSGGPHPNRQGLNLSMLILSAICATPPKGSTFRILWIVIAVLAGGFLLLTKSRTALASLAMAVFVFWIVVVPWRYRLGVVLLSSGLVTVVTLVLLVNVIDPFLMGVLEMGREDSDPTTLTGRIELWQVTLSYALERPVLGYGYEAFWDPQQIFLVSTKMRWGVEHAHSIYVDTLLSIGAVGLLLLLTLLIAATTYAIREANRRQSIEIAGFAALFVYAISHGVFESTLMAATFYGFVVMTAVSALAFPRTDSTSVAKGQI